MRFKAVVVGALLGALGSWTPLAAQPVCQPVDPYNSGGPLDPDEAVYDVRFYDLAITVSPRDSTIAGHVVLVATIVSPTSRVAFDLDTLLAIGGVQLVGEDEALPYVRCGGRTRVDLPRTLQPGETLALRIAYGGRPRLAVNPPWDGGIQWTRTPLGSPWIATSNQQLGADVWWPVKDHVSDKPDSMAITVTVSNRLVVATNGRLRGVSDAPGGMKTWRWFVSTPISTYNVALNIAPYRTIEETIPSVGGDSIYVVFYVLPEDYQKGRELFPEVLEHLRWFERRLGPYPFRADKYGLAQTPHLGMEHQTIIAYGANFRNGAMTGGVDWGFDALHHHELSHEWWGNLVTNADWRDMWIHEGFGTYMQVLWLEDTQGADRARDYVRSFGYQVFNDKPVAPWTSTYASDYSRDIYFKGALVLHGLRWLIGDEAFFRTLRRMLYASDVLSRSTDGSAVHFSGTADFITLAEEESGQELDWFFDVYVRQPRMPRLVSAQVGDRLTLYWEVPDDLPFPMPVEVVVNGQVQRLAMTDGRGSIRVPADAEVAIDPDGRVPRGR